MYIYGLKEEMNTPPIFKKTINLIIRVLLIKGILLIPVTFYRIGRAYLADETTPMVGIVSCAVGTFAFAMAGIAIWIRHIIN